MLIKIGFVWQYRSLLIIVTRQKSWFWPITRLLLEPASSSVAAVAADRLSHDGPISITEKSSREIPLHFLIIESQYDLITLKTYHLILKIIISSSLQLPSFAVSSPLAPSAFVKSRCIFENHQCQICLCPMKSPQFLLDHYHSFNNWAVDTFLLSPKKAPHRG